MHEVMYSHPCCLQVKTSRTFLRDCSVVSPLALLLFGGTLKVVHENAYIALDHFRVRENDNRRNP